MIAHLLRSFVILIGIIFFPIVLTAQTYSVDDFLDKGNEFLSKGKYVDALSMFQQARMLDSNATRPNLELAKVNISLERYPNAIRYLDKVIINRDKYVDEAYLLKGTTLSSIGQFESALQTFNEGLKLFPDNCLLNYNVAFAYYNAGDYDDARVYSIKAIAAKHDHASSHLLLANCMAHSGRRIHAMLSLYYFLLLEPNSKRSLEALLLLDRLLTRGKVIESDGSQKIVISENKLADEFADAEMFLITKQAFFTDPKVRRESPVRQFFDNTKSFFEVVSEVPNKTKATNIWWNMYVPFFRSLTKSNNIEAYCYYITSSLDDDGVKKWMEHNKTKIEALSEWYMNYSD